MIKNISLLLLAFSLHASIPIDPQTQQLLVVSGDGFTNNKATLQAYERKESLWAKVFNPVEVNLGRNGLAWGEGLIAFPHLADEPLKYEGDGKSPAGLFTLDLFFGYEKQNFRFPYLQVNENTLCIDDSDSKEYNRILEEKEQHRFKSFEFMKREDRLYYLGIAVGHNTKRLPRRGSCIFIHIAKQAIAVPKRNVSTKQAIAVPERNVSSAKQAIAVPERNVSLKQAEVVRKANVYPVQLHGAGQTSLKNYTQAATEADLSSARPKTLPTAGCTSMQEDRLLQIMRWLDKDKKPLLLQLPKQYLQKGFQ